MTVATLPHRESFAQTLQRGQVGESRIATWMRKRGWAVLPVYELEIDTGKGPRLFAPEGRQLIAPDMFAFKMNKAGEARWIEAKHKTHFSWHRITGRWVTGIDKRHYEDYCRVDDETPFPVWLLFLHAESKAWHKDVEMGAPATCPTGLFGRPLKQLRDCVNHMHDNWGRTGMVYWAHDSLTRLAALDEVTQ